VLRLNARAPCKLESLCPIAHRRMTDRSSFIVCILYTGTGIIVSLFLKIECTWLIRLYVRIVLTFLSKLESIWSMPHVSLHSPYPCIGYRYRIKYKDRSFSIIIKMVPVLVVRVLSCCFSETVLRHRYRIPYHINRNRFTEFVAIISQLTQQ
jgi:hypothetical protein